jgi:hypothetical protein
MANFEKARVNLTSLAEKKGYKRETRSHGFIHKMSIISLALVAFAQAGLIYTSTTEYSPYSTPVYDPYATEHKPYSTHVYDPYATEHKPYSTPVYDPYATTTYAVPTYPAHCATFHQTSCDTLCAGWETISTSPTLSLCKTMTELQTTPEMKKAYAEACKSLCTEACTVNGGSLPRGW